jgi:hypothetical protein
MAAALARALIESVNQPARPIPAKHTPPLSPTEGASHQINPGTRGCRSAELAQFVSCSISRLIGK